MGVWIEGRLFTSVYRQGCAKGKWPRGGRRSWFALALPLVIALSGCGGGSSSRSAGVFVTLSPITATVSPGGTQQFTATVNNTSNNAVTWQVNGTTGGDAIHGTISSSGLYTAPGAIPTPSTITVTAIAVANPIQTASATVNVVPQMSISPSSATVTAGNTQQFTAQVNFSTDTAVTWQVNGVDGGNSSVGTISTAGLYTAPTVFPLPSGVTVTAVSHADTSKKVSAAVTIAPPAFVISPSNPTVAAGATVQFTATALNQSQTPTWSVQCGSPAPGACGSIAADGTYTAPLSPPSAGSVTVTASSPTGSATTASVTAIIQFANASLSGAYVFAFSAVSAGYPGEAGVANFDGKGNITGGEFDTGTSGGATALAITGGTYSVGTDGRGSATLQTSAGTITWTLVLADYTRAFAIRNDASKVSASGSLQLQYPAQFATLNGNYAFQISGSTSGAATQEAGALQADGSGTVTRAAADIVTPSAVNSLSSLAGSYLAPDAMGRGTLTLGAQTFAYYFADTQHLALVETDGSHALSGQLLAQPAGPFSAASLNGKYSFVLQGMNSSNAPTALGGIFTANGSGAIGNRLLDGFNVPAQLNSTGSYTVSDSALGRTVLTWTNGSTTSKFALYPVTGGSFEMVEIDGAGALSGVVRPVNGSFLTVQALSKGFAVQLAGALPNGTPEFIVGELVLPGGSSFSGTLDLVDGGTLTAGAAVSGTLQPLDVFTGRGFATFAGGSAVLGNARWNLYMLDDSQVLVLDSASDRLLTGVLVRQY